MNEWMRQHQRIVLFFALLAMLGTGFYGVMYLVEGGGSAGRGPDGSYFALDGRRIHVEPEELYQERLVRWHLMRGRDYPGEVALKNLAQVQLAKDMGFDLGEDELIRMVREDIKRRTSQEKVTPELYKNLIEDLQLTQNQYERMMREAGIVSRVVGLFQDQGNVTEGEQYLAYLQRKQTLRIFYQEFNAKDYEELAGDPSPKEITDYYEKYTNPPKEEEPERTVADSMDTDPVLSIDVFYFTKELAEKEVKPTDETLKKYYQENRNFYRRTIKDGDPIPTGDDAYQTFEEAKVKVLADVVRDELPIKANEIKVRLAGELAEAEKKAAESKETFDRAAFAKKHDLTYWRTEKLRQRAFEKGSDKLKAPDFHLAANFFRMAEKGADDAAERKLAEERKRFSGALRVHFNTPEEGFVMTRIAEYSAKELMKLEEATPVIRRRLREERAKKKALDAAVEFRTKWLDGSAVPKADGLTEESCSSSSTPPCRNPLFQDTLRDPKSVGELLPVSSFQGDEEILKDRPDTRMGRYLVGFIAEREMPSLANYEKDTVDRQGDYMAQYQSMMRGRELAYEAQQFLWKYQGIEIDRSRPDAPLNARGAPTAPPPDM